MARSIRESRQAAEGTGDLITKSNVLRRDDLHRRIELVLRAHADDFLQRQSRWRMVLFRRWKNGSEPQPRLRASHETAIERHGNEAPRTRKDLIICESVARRKFEGQQTGQHSVSLHAANILRCGDQDGFGDRSGRHQESATSAVTRGQIQSGSGTTLTARELADEVKEKFAEQQPQIHAVHDSNHR